MVQQTFGIFSFVYLIRLQIRVISSLLVMQQAGRSKEIMPFQCIGALYLKW